VTYDQALVEELCVMADRCGAEKLITTEKDYVKLKHLSCNREISLFQVDYQVDSSFDQFIIEKIAQLRP
jgi:tetraacyldisaccharide-1-P 4'-kinase